MSMPKKLRCSNCGWWGLLEEFPVSQYPTNFGRRPHCKLCITLEPIRFPEVEPPQYQLFCGKCNVSVYSFVPKAPWICSNCRRTPEEREQAAKAQIFSMEVRIGMAKVLKPPVPEYVREEVASEWELRKFHKSGKTIENKEVRRKMKMRMAMAARAAMLAGLPTNYTWERWMEKVDFYGWKCVYCNTELTMKPKQKNRLTCDHFKAIKNGGTHYISNLFPACRSCNSRKGKKLGWKIKYRVLGPSYHAIPNENGNAR